MVAPDVSQLWLQRIAWAGDHSHPTCHQRRSPGVDVRPTPYIHNRTDCREQKEVVVVSTDMLGPKTSAGLGTAEFLVLRQDQLTRGYRWLGLLSRHNGEFHFQYTPQAAADPELRPLPGFPDPDREYRSNGLFATFANRVMTPRRDSYQGFLDMIGLSGDLADPFEVLARTWGTRATDLIQVLPVPVVDEAGRLRMRFLVHGGRYVDPDAEVLTTVHAGDRLSLVPEPENPQDKRAVLVGAGGPGPDRRVGYIPAPLVPFVHSLWAHGIDPEVTAERVNSPHAPLGSNQMRMLARLEATVGGGFDVMAALNPEQVRFV